MCRKQARIGCRTFALFSCFSVRQAIRVEDLVPFGTKLLRARHKTSTDFCLRLFCYVSKAGLNRLPHVRFISLFLAVSRHGKLFASQTLSPLGTKLRKRAPKGYNPNFLLITGDLVRIYFFYLQNWKKSKKHRILINAIIKLFSIVLYKYLDFISPLKYACKNDKANNKFRFSMIF